MNLFKSKNWIIGQKLDFWVSENVPHEIMILSLAKLLSQIIRCQRQWHARVAKANLKSRRVCFCYSSSKWTWALLRIIAFCRDTQRLQKCRTSKVLEKLKLDDVFSDTSLKYVLQIQGLMCQCLCDYGQVNSVSNFKSDIFHCFNLTIFAYSQVHWEESSSLAIHLGLATFGWVQSHDCS